MKALFRLLPFLPACAAGLVVVVLLLWSFQNVYGNHGPLFGSGVEVTLAHHVTGLAVVVGLLFLLPLGVERTFGRALFAFLGVPSAFTLFIALKRLLD